MLYYKTPNDRALLKIEILQEEREYILAAIAASPHNYFTNAWMYLAQRDLSRRIKEISEVVEQQQRDERASESRYDRISIGDHPVYTMKGH
jgi:hypothetical protein